MRCKFCKHFNWKLSSEKNWGECLNPVVLDSIRISLPHVNEIYNHPEPKKLIADIMGFARVQFVEDDFGCIHFEKKESRSPRPAGA